MQEIDAAVAPRASSRSNSPIQHGSANTSIWTLEGWLYLAVILDLYTRRVVGWAMGNRIDQALTLRALRMALDTREPGAGLLQHSHRGSQRRTIIERCSTLVASLAA